MGGHRSSGVFSYSDLTSYCCDISSRTENVEDDALLRKLIQGLGPEGLGLVVVKDVPGMLDLQQKLLPLAREITLLDERDRKLVLKGSGLGSDVPLRRPDRPVSSYAANIKYTSFPRNALDGLPSSSPLVQIVRAGHACSSSSPQSAAGKSGQHADSCSFDAHNAEESACSMVDWETGADDSNTCFLASSTRMARAASAFKGDRLAKGGIPPQAVGGASKAARESNMQAEVQVKLQPESSGLKSSEYNDLQGLVYELGLSMIQVGLLVARLCDLALGGSVRLEEVVSKAGIAKARLIHYHAMEDRHRACSKLNQKSAQKGKVRNTSSDDLGGTMGGEVSNSDSLKLDSEDRKELLASAARAVQPDLALPQAVEESKSWSTRDSSLRHLAEMLSHPEKLWQQWHCDYGLFTALTAPLYLKSTSSSSELSRESYVPAATGSLTKPTQDSSSCKAPERIVLPPQEHAGLHLLNLETGLIEEVDIPLGCIGIQIGEAAQILTGGRLRAAPHCVRRPHMEGSDNISREMFVVFMQPGWMTSMVPPGGCDRETALGSWCNYRVDSIAYHAVEVTSSPIAGRVSESGCSRSSTGMCSDQEGCKCKVELAEVARKALSAVVPPLSTRWQTGDSYATLAQNTTRSYYGVEGKQPNKL